MKVKCIATCLRKEEINAMKMSGKDNTDYETRFIIGKEYVVLGVSHEATDLCSMSQCVLLRDESGLCLAVPLYLLEIIDPRPSIFWRARYTFPLFTLWPIEFYRDFFYEELSEGEPEIKRIFDSVVDRLTYEFEDATQGLPDPLAWPFEEYK